MKVTKQRYNDTIPFIILPELVPSPSLQAMVTSRVDVSYTLHMGIDGSAQATFDNLVDDLTNAVSGNTLVTDRDQHASLLFQVHDMCTKQV